MRESIEAVNLKTLDPRSIESHAFIEVLARFLESYCKSDIENTILSALDSVKHYALSVNVHDIIHHDPELAYLILHHPSLLLPLFNEALFVVQVRMLEIARKNKLISLENATSKQNVHVRLEQVPRVSDLYKVNISSIRNTDLDSIIQIHGTVIRTGMVKMLEVTRRYQCPNKSCNKIFSVECDMSQGNLLVPPKNCPGRNKNSNKNCKASSFQEYGAHHYSDYQEIKVQEQVQKLGVGSIPRSIVVILQDDLVDLCKAGDDVVITGQLLRRWKPVCPDARCSVEITLRANSIRIKNGADCFIGYQINDELSTEFKEMHQVNSHRPLALRNVIVASVCPQIYGLFAVKLAVLLTLIGGITETDHTGMRRRGTSHLLLIGDPGCGKSQFLRFAAKLSPRSVLTTGVGTTSAGLTCTAVKDSGEWMLEAGALVLADRGLCCIDEFSAIKEHDRATIHEAMEQQTLSVAKAGLVCKLNTRTCVFAVTNPKVTYDMEASVTANTAIGSPLLSRFDLILLILDTKDQEWDRVVSTFILREAISDSSTCNESKHGDRNAIEGLRPWTMERLQKYIAWVKERHHTVRLTPDAEVVLTNYYQYQRRCDNKAAPRTTIRLLESLIRISQAHARLLGRSEVLLADAVQSVLCMETSLQSCSLLGSSSILYSEFPQDPDAEFMQNQRIVLDRLGLVDIGT